ncbi:MAG TPA: phage protein Gp27 family protein [Rhodocyclaceae bacterium]|nr:phage protein Gp27 family protein [Rhodocyclaceae bacterium]
MGRKSTIDKLPPEVRTHIEQRLRENRLTLDELFQDVRESFPELAAAPSRSALGRYRMGFEEVMKTQRAMSSAASALVAELGEDFDDKSGALLSQAVTTLATRAAFGQLEKEDIEIADVLDLARAAKSAQEARSLNLRERQAVAKMAREKLLEEQQARAAELTKKAGVTEDTMKAIREVLGIA